MMCNSEQEKSVLNLCPCSGVEAKWNGREQGLSKKCQGTVNRGSFCFWGTQIGSFLGKVRAEDKRSVKWQVRRVEKGEGWKREKASAEKRWRKLREQLLPKLWSQKKSFLGEPALHPSAHPIPSHSAWHFPYLAQKMLDSWDPSCHSLSLSASSSLPYHGEEILHLVDLENQPTLPETRTTKSPL